MAGVVNRIIYFDKKGVDESKVLGLKIDYLYKTQLIGVIICRQIQLISDIFWSLESSHIITNY